MKLSRSAVGPDDVSPWLRLTVRTCAFLLQQHQQSLNSPDLWADLPQGQPDKSVYIRADKERYIVLFMALLM